MTIEERRKAARAFLEERVDAIQDALPLTRDRLAQLTRDLPHMADELAVHPPWTVSSFLRGGVILAWTNDDGAPTGESVVLRYGSVECAYPHTPHYRGHFDATERIVVCPEREFLQPGPSWALRRHADGFDWGYHGGEPLQLALAILMDHTRDEDTAIRHYAAFEREVVSQLSCGGPWSLMPGQVTWWLLQQGEEERFAQQWRPFGGWTAPVPLHSIGREPVALSFPARL